MKRIVLTGGGTAGLVSPNQALIPLLLDEGWEALPGQTMTLALPYSFAFGGTRLTSHEYLWQDEQGASLIELSYEDWVSGRYPGAFTGEIAGALAEVEVRLLAGEDMHRALVIHHLPCLAQAVIRKAQRSGGAARRAQAAADALRPVRLALFR